MDFVGIIAIRSEGYRLTISDTQTEDIKDDQPAAEQHSGIWRRYNRALDNRGLNNRGLNNRGLNNRGLAGACAMLVIVMLGLWLWPQNYSIPPNNRVTIWYSANNAAEPAALHAIRDQWKTVLLQAGVSNVIQYIESDRDNHLSIPAQARRDRLALISVLEMLNSNSNALRLKIIEPQTATILQSQRVPLNDQAAQQAAFQTQLTAIKALIASGKLILTKEQKVNALDPVWQELKSIANPQQPS